MLGLGLGGFVDGIVLHQILQWHHMLTDYGAYDAFPHTGVLRWRRTRCGTGCSTPRPGCSSWWVFLLWRALTAGYPMWRSLPGTLLAGWGLFNLVEGIVDHHRLTIHHVRDDVAEALWWDLGFLAFGALC